MVNGISKLRWKRMSMDRIGNFHCKVTCYAHLFEPDVPDDFKTGRFVHPLNNNGFSV